MPQADTPPVISTYAGSLQDQDEKGSLWELAPSSPDHRLGGHARPIQDSVEFDVAHAQLSGEVRYGDPALHEEALRWALLAQFDSDPWAGMMWGDRGTLYWLIRPGELAARRFEEASFTW